METKILITLAVFSISILLAQSMYINPALAQLTFTTTSLTYTGNSNDQSNCHFIDNEEVWCTSTSGIKIINPTTQAIVATLFSGIEIQDIDCTTTYCYSWFNGGTATGNLTKWVISSRTVNNSTTFSVSGGGVVGRQIDALNAQGAENILVGAGAGCNTSSSSTKGLCIMNGDGNLLQTARFISSGDTGAAAVVFNIKWSETLATVGEPTLNNALIAFQDGAGTRTIKIINLSDPDTTFATTQTCSASFAALGATEMFQIFLYNENYYIPNDVGTTGAYAELPIDSTTCSVTQRYPTTWDVPVALITDGEFFYTASYDGATSRSAFQVYNSSSTALATYNITNTSGAGLPVRNGWNHATEGEVQILGDSRLIVFRTQEGSNPQDEFCDLPENFNILSCVLARGDTTPLVGASELIGESSNTIVCQLGLIECTNFVPNDPDTKTNGVGYFVLFVAMGIIIGIFWVASRGDLGSIPTFLWFIATLAIIGMITAFDLIDPTVLIVAIIAIIALATARAKGIFGSSGLFAGET